MPEKGIIDMQDRTTHNSKVWTENRLKTLDKLRELGEKHREKRIQILRNHRNMLRNQFNEAARSQANGPGRDVPISAATAKKTPDGVEYAIAQGSKYRDRVIGGRNIPYSPKPGTGPSDTTEDSGKITENVRPGKRAIRAGLPIIITQKARERLLKLHHEGIKNIGIFDKVEIKEKIVFSDEDGNRRVGIPIKYISLSELEIKADMSFGIVLSLDEKEKFRARVFHPVTPTRLQAPPPEHLI